MKGILLKIRFLYLGLKNINKLNISDEVLVNRKKYYLSSYKYTDKDGYDYWSMIESTTKKYEIYSIKYIKKCKSIKNIKNSISSTYRFYMSYWYSIMMRKIKLKDVFKADLPYILHLMK